MVLLEEERYYGMLTTQRCVLLAMQIESEAILRCVLLLTILDRVLPYREFASVRGVWTYGNLERVSTLLLSITTEFQESNILVGVARAALKHANATRLVLARANMPYRILNS